MEVNVPQSTFCMTAMMPFLGDKYVSDCCKPLVNFQNSEKVDSDYLPPLFSLLLWRKASSEICTLSFLPGITCNIFEVPFSVIASPYLEAALKYLLNCGALAVSWAKESAISLPSYTSEFIPLQFHF